MVVKEDWVILGCGNIRRGISGLRDKKIGTGNEKMGV